MATETREVTTVNQAILEQVVVGGDLSKLSAADRVSYYNRVCESLGLNPFTKPFSYITLNGRLTLYANRDATDQLRRRDHVSVRIVSRERLDDLYIVTAHAELPDGRSDESIGAVTVGTLKGDALANALMKCETKAKRRATLSLCGLGWLDETEIETIPDARPLTQPEPQPASDDARPPAPGMTDRRARLLRRWEELWKQARQLGVPGIDDLVIDSAAPEQEIIERGKTLLALIESQQAQQAAF